MRLQLVSVSLSPKALATLADPCLCHALVVGFRFRP